MGELVSLIQKIKNGKKEKFGLIVEKMEPLIRKYIRLLFKDEKEDVRAELLLALWEGINNIEYINNDGQVQVYLCRALKNKFFELYRSSRARNDNQINAEDDYILKLEYNDNSYNDLIFKKDMQAFLSEFSENKQRIYYLMIFENLSDIEIAECCNVSRQYINRLRRDMRKILIEKKYFLYHKNQ